MKIYKIIDKENGDEQVGDFYQFKRHAVAKLESKLRVHCWRISHKINQLTGVKRGKGKVAFEELVDSISNPRFAIVEVQVSQRY